MNERATAATAESLYLPRQKVYPREVSGRFATLRAVAAWVLLGLFYLVPWLQWNGRQAVLFDLPARKFYVFGLVLWPQDFIFLTALLTIAALSLFFFTALAGRLWCGYACPQTVWTEVFLWLERFAEGDRNERMKLDRSPWTAHKIARKSLKQALWIAFALWTGFTFVGYFSPLSELLHRALDFSLGPWETFWTFFYGFATYGNAGYLREQVCKYMCPYARFQGVMFDRDTMVVTYDAGRGEPRGARGRKVDHKAQGLGDCIDCTMCVQVCPTGIDIRNGLQYECIGCAACIDACNQVMDKMGYPRGLIRYTTENGLANGWSFSQMLKRVFRPRVLAYSVILLGIISVTAYSLYTRVPLKVDVIRDRASLMREVEDGLLENVYRVQIMNTQEMPHTYRITATGLESLHVASDDVIQVPAATTRQVPLRLRIEGGMADRGAHKILIQVQAVDDPSIAAVEDSVFIVQ